MGRYLLGFVLSFLLILPLQAKDNECGMNEDGTVSDYSFEVCEEDKAFSMLYSIMPEVFDNNLFNVFDLGEVENLKNSPEILYDKQFNRFTPILVVIISSVLDLTILFASFFIAYKSFWSLLTAIQRGDFIADRQISPKTLFIIGFLISISLVKVFDLVMIQVLVLLMAMAAISIANFMFSAFLSSVEKKNYASEDIEIDRVDIQQNHNDSIARNYITSLTKMALCREITSQYIMSMNASMINNDNYEESKNCSAGIDGIGVSNQVFSDTDLLDNNKPYPTFISHDLSPFDHKWDQEVASTYQVSFGINKPKTCDIDTFIDYQCGSITTVLPTINDNALLKAIGKDKFSNVVWGVIKSLNLNGGNSMRIQNGWKSIYSMIETKLKSYNSYELGTEEYELADKIINQRNNVAIKRVAYYYHQLIQNALTTGITTAVNQYPTDSVFMAGKAGESFVADSYTTSIQTDFQRATQLAKKIQKQHCILNNKNVAESVNFQRKLTGTGNRASNVNPYCVDIDTLEVYGADNNGEPLDNRSSEVLTEVRDLQIEVVKETIDLSREVAKRRMEVEASLSMVLRDLDGSDFLKSIRQQGFMVMPNYMMKVSREIRNNEFYFEALIKSGNFLPIKTDSNFVADSISGLNSTADFEPYINHSNVFAKLQNQYSDSVYANSSQYVVSVIENNEEELYKGNQTFKEIYSTLFQSPFNRFEQAIGVYDIKNHKDFNAKSCSEVSDLCPIPVNDPIIELNQFGHFLIKNSIAFFGISAGLNASMSTKTLLDDRKAKKAAKKNINYKKQSNDTSSFLSVLDIANKVLGMLFTVQMALGIYLAYVLPLIPTFFFAMAFLSWFLVVIQALIISPILVINMLRWDEEKQNIIKYLSVYTVQILLKPVIMITIFIVSFFIFKVLLYFINSVSLSLFGQTNGQGFVMAFVQDLLAIIAMSYLVFVVLRMCFNLINNSMDFILEKLEAKTSSGDDFSKVEQLVEAAMTQKGSSMLGKAFETAGKFGKGKKEGKP